MLGSSAMVNKDQVEDCLNRSWIVLVPNHRLCPQVDVLEGPMQDCRDLLAWIYDGGLQKAISSEYPVDLDHVFAFGTSSGGTLALSLVRRNCAPYSRQNKTTWLRSPLADLNPKIVGFRCASSSGGHI
jgi:acetyl esterase/lipase